MHLSPVFSYYMLGSTILVIAAILISFFHRISLHMIGIGGMAGALLGMAGIGSQMTIIALFLILCAGLTGSARVKISIQNPSGVYSGFMVGLIVMFTMFRMI